MSTDPIKSYSNNIGILYGDNPYRKNNTDTIAETGATAKNDEKSTPAPSSSASGADMVNLSQSSGFFQKLKQLEENDPEKYSELFNKLEKKLDSALGYAGQILTDINKRISNGEDLSEILD